jgi:hypothetical protein
MSTSTEINNMTDTDLPPMLIVLAESDPVEIDRIMVNIDPKFHYGIKIVNNYQELLENIAQKRPQLVMLGKIDKSNYTKISNDCQKIRNNLQIFLLSSQVIIIDSFRQLVKSCGLTDVISKDPNSLNKLLEAAENHARQTPAHKPTDKSIVLQFLTNQSLGQDPDKSTHQLLTNELNRKPKISGHVMLTALEEIVTVSNNYFGPLAQGNYWRKAHARITDEFPSIQNWEVDHFSKLSCDENLLDRELTVEDIQSLRIWVQFFIEECERIIIDYRIILNTSDLSLSAKDLLPKS